MANVPSSDDLLDPAEVLTHLDWLQRLCHALVASAQEAEDIAQETVRRALARRQGVRDVKGYLGGIARHVRSEWARRQSTRRALPLEDVASTVGTDARDDPHGEQVELLQCVLTEVERLPDAQRRCVLSVYVGGLTPAQVAERDGGTASGVRANVARGLAQVRERLDGRNGGRAAWVGILGPWSLPPGTAAATAGPAAPAAPVAVSLAATSTGLLSLAMLAKVAVAATALVGTLVLVRSSDTAEPAASGRVNAGDEGAENLAHLQSSSTDGPGRRADLADAQGPAARTEILAAPLPSARGLDALELRLVDTAVGDPIPYARVSLPDLRVGDQRPQARADAAGRIVFRDLDVHGDIVWIDVTTPGKAALSRRVSVRLPVADDVRVQAGPTFFLEGPIAERARRTPFTAEVSGPGIDVGRHPSSTVVVEEDGTAWVRFLDPFGNRGREGPWTLHFRSDDGLWSGEAGCFQRAGFSRRPIHVDPDPRGAIAFELERGPGVGDGVVLVQVNDPNGRPLPDVGFPGRPSAGSTPGEAAPVPEIELAGGLCAGTFTWSCTHGERTVDGAVDVVLGRTARTVVRLEAAGATERRFVAVRVVDALDLSPDDVRGQFYRTDGGLETIPATVERDPSSPGDWRVPVPALPAGNWSLVLGASRGVDGVRLEPRTVALGPDGPIAPIVLRSAPHVEVTLTVEVDSNRLHAIDLVHADGVEQTWIDPTDDGVYRVVVPADRATAFYVHLPDHDLTRVECDPHRTGEELVARPERGQRTCVAVFDARALEPVEGVEVVVNGATVGRTDAGGEVWFEPSGGVVEAVTLGESDAARFQVLASPGEGTNNIGRGYVFAVSPR